MLLILLIVVVFNMLAGNPVFDHRTVNSIDKSVPAETSQEAIDEVSDDTYKEQ